MLVVAILSLGGALLVHQATRRVIQSWRARKEKSISDAKFRVEDRIPESKHASVSAACAAKSVGTTCAQLEAKPSVEKASPAPVSKVSALIKAMSSPEGRQSLRDSEEASGIIVHSIAETTLIHAPPAERIKDDVWRIRGIYRYQALKAGLRILDETWATDDMLTFPKGRLSGGGRSLMREKIIAGLLTGTMQLKSIPVNDVAAAQRDLEQLTVRQLLRLRVAHLDFTPSGCGVDSISTVGTTHEAFMSKLDGRLFKLLGQTACGCLTPAPEDLHQLGCEVVVLAAAAEVVPKPQWWCWWRADGSRVFFDTAAFACSGSFPDVSDGILEIEDLSKADKYEPTGKLLWFDWRICLVMSADGLTSKPPAQPQNAKQEHLEGLDTDSKFGTNCPASKTSASGPNLSPTLLLSIRSNLRKSPKEHLI